MRRRLAEMVHSRWLITLGAVLALALTGFMRPVDVLVVSDPATGQILWQAATSPGATFTAEYVNEAYDAPVQRSTATAVERFRVESPGRLLLREVGYGSLALTND